MKALVAALKAVTLPSETAVVIGGAPPVPVLLDVDDVVPVVAEVEVVEVPAVELTVVEAPDEPLLVEALVDAVVSEVELPVPPAPPDESVTELEQPRNTQPDTSTTPPKKDLEHTIANHLPPSMTLE